MVGAARPPTGPPAAAVATALVAVAVSGAASVKVPLTSLPVLVVAGSATLSVASPALEITFAEVDAVYSRATPGVNAPNDAGAPRESESVAGTVPPASDGFGMMRPNRPAVSPLGPAVKYRWLRWPLLAAPEPNWIAHRPPMNSGCPLRPRSVPDGVHVPSAFSWNALMRPSPKLPISRSPP